MDLIQADIKLQTAVKTLKDAFNPLRLILFGSRALGTSSEESDYDFVMIVPGANEAQLKSVRSARRLLAKIDIDADIFIYSQEEYDEWKTS
jgi:predicted nucleotidyltransferase